MESLDRLNLKHAVLLADGSMDLIGDVVVRVMEDGEYCKMFVFDRQDRSKINFPKSLGLTKRRYLFRDIQTLAFGTPPTIENYVEVIFSHHYNISETTQKIKELSDAGCNRLIIITDDGVSLMYGLDGSDSCLTIGGKIPIEEAVKRKVDR